MIVPIQICLDYTKMKKKKVKMIKPRVIDMIKFLLRPNKRHRSVKDYNRLDKKWRDEDE